jgi:hypothetical protein
MRAMRARVFREVRRQESRARGQQYAGERRARAESQDRARAGSLRVSVSGMARVGALMRRGQLPESGVSSRVERAESRGWV